MVTCCNVSCVRIPRNWNLLRRCTSHPWRFPSLQGNGRLTCWIEAMLDSYLPNILDKEDGGKSAEMWSMRYDWNCGSKLKSYCHYSDVNMDVTWFNLCKITTWSRNKMPEACCKAAHIWDLILFEEFHIFVRFISSLIDFPYVSPFCCSVVCLFNPVFFFLFSVALAHCRDLTFSNLQIWLQKKPIAICFKPWPWKCEDVVACYSWPWHSCGKPLLLRKVRGWESCLRKFFHQRFCGDFRSSRWFHTGLTNVKLISIINRNFWRFLSGERHIGRAAMRQLLPVMVASSWTSPSWAEKGVTTAWKTRPDGGEDCSRAQVQKNAKLTCVFSRYKCPTSHALTKLSRFCH